MRTDILTRHSLAWLSAEGWQRAALAATADKQATLARWQQEDWPLVLRRRAADTPPDELCLGLALPPDGNGDKARIPLQVQLTDVQRFAEPLTLRQALAHMPSGWSGPLRAFAGDCLHSGIALRLYGSWAWQILTRQSYVTANSDIDLLFTPRNASEFSRGMALLAQHAARLPLDGEVIFPDGHAVAWKECWQALQAGAEVGAAARVLVKTESAVQLRTLASLMSSLEPA
ncbi:malonate decarboxylase holo-[acyl-carrier-protein] synthase [Collimonas sp.]|jgi:phosphoribosyl-dephospho-CoA transferase|uniref:malonate decarboxylase holo-[acyl-carrier-protein] synthase n=1 Tax=Collimonas sp. TaxID=1963772 RepID=UPI002B67C7AD|nr:malonate decarboxylase holo-[acyl-carrier-protein] synthase [Collimonas sp.]HWX03898.1 malonate decarboxylase holo-[acyl-carrier-protein] synthase [Collimonas sp.]